ncbi:MAG: hypothetical protein V3S22_00545 [Candidatus Neomarinimicrobiota bacterium]
MSLEKLKIFLVGRKALFRLIQVLTILFLFDSIMAQTPLDMRGNALYRRLGLMDGNLVSTLFKNYGEVTDYPNEPSANWPSLGKHYCDGVALIVSAEVLNDKGVLIHPMETQYREFVDKSPEDIPWGFEPRPHWFNMDTHENKVPAMSNEPVSWPPNWPDKPDSWNGYWNGYFGKGIFNADLETVFVFDDDPDKEPNLRMDYYCDENDHTRGGLGLWVKARGFQWSHILAEDCIFWLYNITNESSHAYPKTFYAQYIDWGVGGVEDGADDIGEYDVDRDIAYAYDTDGIGTPGNWSPVGYAGYAFLESPGIETDEIDNDNDGIIDEKRYSTGPGVYLGDYPYGFEGDLWDRFTDYYLQPPRPHWSEDEDCDWTPFTDMNSNGVRDEDEPLNDDLGADGVSPYDLHYEGPDEGEGDGRPTDGEPNYNKTDPDESDQIGLTGFDVFATHYYELTNDEENWDVFRRALPPHDQILRPNNLAMFFSSGTFPLDTDQTERYSMALLFGEDLDDLIKNKRTVQQIYNADYRFAKPPLKPNVKVMPGDGKVTIVWDDIAEKSFDPFLQEFDFEGYLIYKSTEPQFLENKVITDSYGNLTFRKPVAQFDLRDGKSGLHPIGIYGTKFNLGTDSGLKHTWTDYDVKNGLTYYYAVVSYDYGLFNYTSTGAEGIPPSECSAIIKTNSLGEVTFLDINTGAVTPRPPAAGYSPPGVNEMQHIGPGTGLVSVQVVQDYLVPSGYSTYELSFLENSKYNISLEPYLQLLDFDADSLVFDSILIDIVGQETPIFSGAIITITNETAITYDEGNSGWIDGYSDFETKVSISPRFEDIGNSGRSSNLPLPADFEITFHDSIVADTYPLFGSFPIPSSVSIFNITDSTVMDLAILDYDKSGNYSTGDDIIIVIPDSKFYYGAYTSWVIRFAPDAAGLSTDPPGPGDKFLIKTKKPFRQGDVFRFTIQGADSSNARAKDELKNIYVVPNPYVVTVSWESKHYYQFGRGKRLLRFFNLPQYCTIRIYNLRGHLIDTIEHHSAASDGMEAWDLLSKDGQEIAYGIYLYHVEAPGIGETSGKFAVIK